MLWREGVVWAAGLIWLAGSCAGLWVWERYDATPGAECRPDTTTNVTTPGGWRLTVFAHPHCPCSRATIRESAELAAVAPELSTRVLFVRPPGGTDGWERGESWDLAEGIPRATVACDADGAEARRFGAETSGQAVLTDPSGRVVFRGGLTAARGRAGESIGRRAVLAWVEGRPAPDKAPVFGCPLFTPND